MQRYAARRLCRQLLSNRSSQFLACIHTHHRHHPIRPSIRYGTAQVIRKHVPVRSFLNLFGDSEEKRERNVAKPSLEPGMETLLSLVKRAHLQVRLPPQQELIQAFNAVVHSKTKYSRPIEDTHALPLLQTLEVLENRHNLENSPSLDRESVIAALRGLGTIPSQGYTQPHKNLAMALTDALNRRSGKDAQPFPKTLTTILASTGDVMEARDLVESYCVNNTGQERSPAPWVAILIGFSKQQDEEQFHTTIEMMKSLGIKFSPNIVRTIAVHYAQKDDVGKAKEWFSSVDFSRTFNATNGSSLADDDFVYRTLLEFCLRHEEMEFGNSIMQTAERSHGPFNKWEAIFQASAATGKSIEQMDEMLAIMNRRADQSRRQELRPNVDVFNAIIEFATSKNDPYLAERYFGLMEKWHIAPDAKTYLLQIQYRLIAGDVDGALASYRILKETNQVKIPHSESSSTFNSLLQALTTSPKIPHDTIMQVFYDLFEPSTVFPADTVFALSKYHLYREDYFNLVNLLQTYSYQYSITDRLKIRDMLVDYTLDTATDTGGAWEAYMVWHQVFDRETTRDVLVETMANFFERKRPDLATHVFTRMSSHERADTRPDLDTYIKALEGIAATREPEALEVVHNMLKLDTNVEPCTRLRNALMLAYACCGMPGRAIWFWREIAWSDEGPSMNSLHIVFRACENSPRGRKVAGIIKDRIHAADMEIDKKLFMNWVVVLGAQGLYDEMFQEIQKMRDVTGEGPDLLTIGSIFNGMPGENGQVELERFCLEHYPDLWNQLVAHREKHGVERSEESWYVPRINNMSRSFPT